MVKPIDTIREGNVSVSIWENARQNHETKEDFLVLSASMQRSVVTEEGTKYYNSFTIPDLKKLIVCLEKTVAKYTKPEFKAANTQQTFTSGWKELKL